MHNLSPTSPPAAALTYRDVAALLRCSTKSVERRGDAIPGRFKLGRLVRFDAERIRSWVADGCPPAAAK